MRFISISMILLTGTSSSSENVLLTAAISSEDVTRQLGASGETLPSGVCRAELNRTMHYTMPVSCSIWAI